MNSFTLRTYQQEAVDKGHQFLTRQQPGHGLMVLPTGSGKSLVIAGLIDKLQAPCLVFQPSREILMQNFDKLLAYGYRAGIYSASLGEKKIRPITLATIGSVVKKPEDFAHVKYVIVDEAHLVNSKEGMYESFLGAMDEQGVRILGLTATPYRLHSSMGGSTLRFLTRTNPRIFSTLVYFVQNGHLFDKGYLAKLQYFTIKGFDRSKLRTNSTGADYTDESIKLHFRELDFAGKLQRVVERLIEIKRKGVLVFTRFVEESEALKDRIPGAAIVTAQTASHDRARILRDFKEGRIKVVCNVGVLTTGFDYPELDSVVLARPTKSLGLYYQMVGRCVRPHESKEHAMIVDMVGLQDMFGKVEDLEIKGGHTRTPFCATAGRQLTNVYL